MSALDTLIEAVEAGSVRNGVPGLKAFEDMARAFLDLPSSNAAFRACHGSLDAALALHESLLPGWHWQHGFAVGGHGSHAATVWLPHMEDAQWKVHFAVSETPARAWLLAILRAYRSVQA